VGEELLLGHVLAVSPGRLAELQVDRQCVHAQQQAYAVEVEYARGLLWFQFVRDREVAFQRVPGGWGDRHGLHGEGFLQCGQERLALAALPAWQTRPCTAARGF
jgi:hypothetical protein